MSNSINFKKMVEHHDIQKHSSKIIDMYNNYLRELEKQQADSLVKRNHGRMTDVHWLFRLANQNTEEFYLIQDKDVSIGFIRISYNLDVKITTIKELYIAPKYRKKGNLTKAVEHIVNVLKSLGWADVITLSVYGNSEAKSAFEKIGFEPISHELGLRV